VSGADKHQILKVRYQTSLRPHCLDLVWSRLFVYIVYML